jgi:CDP-glycerol glycerophosphotransferase (TagB/SpsB family)
MTADHFIVWGEVMYQELKGHYGISDDKIHKCGVPHFDHHIQVREAPAYRDLVAELGLHPQKPYLFFAMSSPRFAPREMDIVERLAANIEQDHFGPDLQLIVRPHPQNVQGFMADHSWLSRMEALQSERVAVDFPRLNKSKMRWSMQQKDMDRLSNLLTGCSICLNSGSTVSIDALMHNKPVVLTSFDDDAQLNYWKSARRLVDYAHLRKFVELGGAKVVRSTEALNKLIEKYLEDPDFDLSTRRFALEKECFRDDGQATDRVLRAVNDILDPVYQDI